MGMCDILLFRLGAWMGTCMFMGVGVLWQCCVAAQSVDNSLKTYNFQLCYNTISQWVHVIPVVIPRLPWFIVDNHALALGLRPWVSGWLSMINHGNCGISVIYPKGLATHNFLVRDFEITWFQLWFRDFNSDFMISTDYSDFRFLLSQPSEQHDFSSHLWFHDRFLISIYRFLISI